jgi:hypothetical protein
MSLLRARARRSLAALLAVAGLTLPAPAASPADAPKPVRFSTPFLLREQFWVNLHHFLYVLGRAENGERDAWREAVLAAPAEAKAARLNAVERRIWDEAVAAYAADLSKMDPIFDRRLIAFTLALTRVKADATRPAASGEDAAAAILERAAPVYRKHWYPTHRAANARFIAVQTPLIDAHAPAMIARVSRAWSRTWPAEGVPIAVSGYANWAGAYSTEGPLVVVSSCHESLEGELGLEILVHEALHQWDNWLMARLDAAGSRAGVPVPDGLWHALIFYSAGHAAAMEFGEAYVPYAHKYGNWRRGIGRFLPAIEARWKPYLDGAGTLDEALEAVLKALPTTRGGPAGPPRREHPARYGADSGIRLMRPVNVSLTISSLRPGS